MEGLTELQRGFIGGFFSCCSLGLIFLLIQTLFPGKSKSSWLYKYDSKIPMPKVKPIKSNPSEKNEDMPWFFKRLERMEKRIMEREY